MAEGYLKHPSACNVNIMKDLSYNLKDESPFLQNSFVGYYRSSSSRAFFTNGFSSYMTAKYSDISQMSRAIKAFI